MFRVLYRWSSLGDELDCLRFAICSTFVPCYCCISILIIILTRRYCSPRGPLCKWSAVALLDFRHPCIRNSDSTVSTDDVRMKSYVDGLFDPTSIPVRVSIYKRNLVPNRKVPSFVGTRGKFRRFGYAASRMSLSCSSILAKVFP